MGGDEFAALLPSSHANDFIRAVFSSLSGPLLIQDMPHRCTVSMGLTTFPTDAREAGDLLKNADLALYRAKEMGRDRYQHYAADMRASLERRYRLQQEIERALARNELRLVFQPIVSAVKNGPASFEALLRWEHPERGLLSPSEFEVVFDDAKLASELGKWVLEHALREASSWQRSGLPFGRIAVNVTMADFALGTFPDFVREKLGEMQLAPDRLTIEVTEGVFLGRGAGVIERSLQQLHELGVEIALDDFGTGFASLSHLKRFPIDRLKVDRSFVRDMATNPDNLAIVRTIVQLGHSLNIKVTIEGVETTEQRNLLRIMGCDAMQGYLFSRPLTPGLIERYLREPGTAISA